VTARLDDAVELLDRAVAYTRVCLADVAADMLGRPTPCARWTLDDLLDHMSDSLDAFTEAAAGQVPLRPAPPAPGTGLYRTVQDRVTALQQRACALLAAWTVPAPRRVSIGEAAMPRELLVETAALEIAVHGWDVARATGRRTPLPEPLARRLLGVAAHVVTEADRGPRFAPARPASRPSYEHRLLAFLGRS